ncbi:NUDIX domain-containing protein [Microbacterium aurum]
MSIVVGAVIVREGHVLAARRTRPVELAGQWEFPGGKVEHGEDLSAAVVREIGEELHSPLVAERRLRAPASSPARECLVNTQPVPLWRDDSGARTRNRTQFLSAKIRCSRPWRLPNAAIVFGPKGSRRSRFCDRSTSGVSEARRAAPQSLWWPQRQS